MNTIPVLPGEELTDQVGRLNNLNSDKDRLRLLKMTARNFSVDCSQLVQLTKTCFAADVKIECIVLFYENLLDKKNFECDKFELPFPEDRKDLNEKISGLSLNEDDAEIKPAARQQKIDVIGGTTSVVRNDPNFISR